MKIVTAATLLLVCAQALGAAPRTGKKVQCWTDESGQRACGDSIPPRYAGQGHDEINKSGVTVQKIPRDPTPEEIEAAEKAKVKAAAEEKVAAHQRAYDRYLIESFQNVGELEKQRDSRLSALDTRIDLVKKAIDSSQAQLDGLVARKQALQRENKPIDKRLEGQIQEYRRAVIENPKSLQALTAERERVMAQFDTDIARFRELRHEPPAGASIDPAPQLPATP